MNGPNPSAFRKVNTLQLAIARDHRIMAAAQAGSTAAFTLLHKLYSGRLYKTIVAITRNSEDAEDALQEAFLRIYLGARTFAGRSTVYSWLTRIAINSALMILRKKRARSEILFDPQPDPLMESSCFLIEESRPNPEEACSLHQRRVMFQKAIHHLEPHLRAPLQMQLTGDMAIKEIGQVLKLSEAAVKTRLHRARRQLSRNVGRPDTQAKRS